MVYTPAVGTSASAAVARMRSCSSGVKEIAYFGGDVSPCVPEFVAKMIQDKFKGKGE